MEIKEKLLCAINNHIESFTEITQGYGRFINEELKIGFGKYYARKELKKEGGYENYKKK